MPKSLLTVCLKILQVGAKQEKHKTENAKSGTSGRPDIKPSGLPDLGSKLNFENRGLHQKTLRTYLEKR